MKKILVLTYYFRPCNYVAANRPNNFANFFAENNWDVTVVTRNWTGAEKTWPDYLSNSREALKVVTEPNGVKIHYLPYKAFEYPKSRVAAFLKSAKLNLAGIYHFELDYTQYADYITQLASKEKYDYILVSCPPLSILKIASEICNKFGIKLLVDIRDFENDIILHTNTPTTFTRKIQHEILMRYFKGWVSNATAVFTVSPALTDYIAKRTHKEAFTLMNGFDDFISEIKEDSYKDAFNVSVIGTIYPGESLSALLEGIRHIFEKYPEIKIKFNLIGVKSIPEVADEFARIIPPESLNLTHRMDRLDALKIAAKSQLLLMAGFESRGVYTTKVFEYLALNKNIIQMPGDRDVVEALLNYTQGGSALYSPEEFCKQVIAWYQEWEREGTLAYHGIESRIFEYSRRNQFQKLLEKLENTG